MNYQWHIDTYQQQCTRKIICHTHTLVKNCWAIVLPWNSQVAFYDSCVTKFVDLWPSSMMLWVISPCFPLCSLISPSFSMSAPPHNAILSNPIFIGWSWHGIAVQLLLWFTFTCNLNCWFMTYIPSCCLMLFSLSPLCPVLTLCFSMFAPPHNIILSSPINKTVMYSELKHGTIMELSPNSIYISSQGTPLLGVHTSLFLMCRIFLSIFVQMSRPKNTFFKPF